MCFVSTQFRAFVKVKLVNTKNSLYMNCKEFFAKQSGFVYLQGELLSHLIKLNKMLPTALVKKQNKQGEAPKFYY